MGSRDRPRNDWHNYSLIRDHNTVPDRAFLHHHRHTHFGILNAAENAATTNIAAPLMRHQNRAAIVLGSYAWNELSHAAWIAHQPNTVAPTMKNTTNVHRNAVLT
jgi:hypothetical protein